MFETRLATLDDAPIITHHRHRMFVDAGRKDDKYMQMVSEAFEPWVRHKIKEGRYIGWLTTQDGIVVAGAGLLLLDWPPHPLDPEPFRGYLLNVYVEPEFRRKHLATNLIELALAEARRRKIKVVSLHSTEEGRPLYKSSGFRPTNEMFFVDQPVG